MPLVWAVGIAFGLTLAVLGFVYIGWRSAGRDRTASIVRGVLNALSVSMWVGMGTFFLFVRRPNVLVGVGMAIFAYASAFRTGFMGWYHLGPPPSESSFKTMLRVYSSSHVLAACLWATGRRCSRGYRSMST
jgi:hypothetical protein